MTTSETLDYINQQPNNVSIMQAIEKNISEILADTTITEAEATSFASIVCMLEQDFFDNPWLSFRGKLENSIANFPENKTIAKVYFAKSTKFFPWEVEI